MDSINNTQPSATCRSTRPFAGYRLMARDGHRHQSLVCLAESLPQATSLAKALCDARNDGPDRDGIVAVGIEEWVATGTAGSWRPLTLWHCRYQNRHWHRPVGNGKPQKPVLPRAGEAVQCVLLDEKTRKGGWKAKLAQGEIEGPITNSGDVPKGATPGQAVTLRVAAVSSHAKAVQFRWQPADKSTL